MKKVVIFLLVLVPVGLLGYFVYKYFVPSYLSYRQFERIQESQSRLREILSSPLLNGRDVSFMLDVIDRRYPHLDPHRGAALAYLVRHERQEVLLFLKLCLYESVACDLDIHELVGPETVQAIQRLVAKDQGLESLEGLSRDLFSKGASFWALKVLELIPPGKQGEVIREFFSKSYAYEIGENATDKRGLFFREACYQLGRLGGGENHRFVRDYLLGDLKILNYGCLRAIHDFKIESAYDSLLEAMSLYLCIGRYKTDVQAVVRECSCPQERFSLVPVAAGEDVQNIFRLEDQIMKMVSGGTLDRKKVLAVFSQGISDPREWVREHLEWDVRKLKRVPSRESQGEVRGEIAPPP